MKKKDVEEKLKYYMSLNYPMVITREEGVYFVQFPDLQGCMIHGKTPASAIRIAEEVKADWIREILKLGLSVPEPRKDEDFSGKFIVRIPPALHKRLSEQAASEGRSLNAHVATLLSEKSAAMTVETAVASTVNNMKQIEEAIVRMENVANNAIIRVEQAVKRVEGVAVSMASATSGKEIAKARVYAHSR